MSCSLSQDNNLEPDARRSPSPMSTSSLSEDLVYILRGNFHQNDERFPAESRGRQCVAMAAASIIRQFFQNPEWWVSTYIDEVLQLGSEIFEVSCANRGRVDPLERNADYLFPGELHPFYKIYENVVCDLVIQEDVNGLVFNSLGGVPDLKNFLRDFHTSYETGILTCNEYSFAISLKNEEFYFFNSHATDEFGKTSGSGVASVLRTRNINALFDVILSVSAVNRANDYQYSFSSVGVVPKSARDISCQDRYYHDVTDIWSMNLSSSHRTENFTAHRYGSGILTQNGETRILCKKNTTNFPPCEESNENFGSSCENFELINEDAAPVPDVSEFNSHESDDEIPKVTFPDLDKNYKVIIDYKHFFNRMKSAFPCTMRYANVVLTILLWMIRHPRG